jgi:prepilin-type N-terminal cleavage/methylation domain-containing protein
VVNIKRENGFTIIELLIVMAVIALLSLIVLNSFQNVQSRSRDTERKTDIVAISTQLELYYQDNGGYPVISGGIGLDTWIKSNMKGADPQAFWAPKQTTNSMSATGTPSINQYGYLVLDSDGVTTCAVSGCAKYRLYYMDEESGVVKLKNSLN